MKEIPVLDFSLWSSDPEKFASKLGKAFSTTGFVRIVNHTIQPTTIVNLLDQSQTFFNRTLQEKSTLIQNNGGQTGYVPPGSESAKGSDVADLKEFYHYAREGNPRIPMQYFFEEAMHQMYEEFFLMADKLMMAVALSLDLPMGHFSNTLRDGDSLLRVLHYPPITKDPGEAMRAEQQEDINLITLLIGANAKGLQVLDVDGKTWIDIEPNQDELIVNPSDMLHRLTNGVYRSVTHRVVNPPKTEWHKPRISIPFFVHPISGLFKDNSFSLTPLENCVVKSGQESLGPITASQFLAVRLYELGLLPDHVMIDAIRH